MVNLILVCDFQELIVDSLACNLNHLTGTLLC